MDKFVFKGHIKVYSGNRVVSDDTNTITSLFQEIVAANGIGLMYNMASPVEAGQSFVDTRVYAYKQYYHSYEDHTYLLTVYLLNLSDAEKSALSSSTSMLPVFTSGYEIDESKLVGYATAKYTASAAKEGYLTEVSGLNIVNPRRHALAFKWDKGVLSGEYNTIAIGVNVMEDKFSGIKVVRGVDFNNVILGETVSGGYFLCPNVKTADGSVVYTTEQEILVGDGSDVDSARRVVNLVTGEITTLATTDHRYNFPLQLAKFTQYCANGYLLYHVNNGAWYRMDLKTLTSTNITSAVYSSFVYNGYFYAPYNGQKLYAYNMSTFARVSSADLTIANLNIPSEFLTLTTYGGLKICNIGENFLVTFGEVTTGSGTSFRCGILCSDITNVKGSIIEIIPQQSCACGCTINGVNYFFSSTLQVIGSTYSAFRYSNASGTVSNIAKAGVKFTKQGLYGQLLSFKTYDEPQTINTSESLKVEYYYSFEQ